MRGKRLNTNGKHFHAPREECHSEASTGDAPFSFPGQARMYTKLGIVDPLLNTPWCDRSRGVVLYLKPSSDCIGTGEGKAVDVCSLL